MLDLALRAKECCSVTKPGQVNHAAPSSRVNKGCAVCTEGLALVVKTTSIYQPSVRADVCIRF